MAVRTTSLRHMSWWLGTRLVGAIPALQQIMPMYTRMVPAASRGAVLQEDSLTRALLPSSGMLSLPGGFRAPLPDQVTTTRRIYAFSTVSLHGRTGAILDEAAKSCIQFRWERDFVSYHNFRPLPSRRVEPTDLSPDRPLFSLMGSAVGYRHFFHFIFDRLPRLHYWLTTRPGPVTLLVNEDLPGFQRDLFRHLQGLHPGLELLPVPKTRRLALPRLHAAEVWQPVKSTFATEDFLSWLQPLYPQIYGVADNAPRHRLYITRSDAAKRRILNEPDLLDRLRPLGFQPVALGRLPFAEQVRLMARAEIVVGPHGAGLTHLGWAAPDCRVVELFPAEKVKDTYALLCLARGLAWQGVVGSRGDGRENFSIALPDLMAALERLPGAL